MLTDNIRASQRRLEAENEVALRRNAKRVKHQQQMASTMDAMDVSDDDPNNNARPKQNPDEILVQMVQTGNYSYDQVVQFCISSNIPLSRMLRLDLMRQGKMSS